VELLEKSLLNVQPYFDRNERARFIVDTFGDYLEGKLLDVGCSENQLKDVLPEGIIYTGLDIDGEVDVTCDLDRESIPFEAGSFTTVVCADVLEHLENIHSVYAALFELAEKNVILSLPNCWCDMKYLMAKQGLSSGKFYGLPSVKPDDRHRWYFNYSEARNFLLDNIDNSVKTARLYKYYGPRGWTFKAGKLLFAQPKFDNLYVNTLWAVFSK
jgi:hypothetical protein